MPVVLTIFRLLTELIGMAKAEQEIEKMKLARRMADQLAEDKFRENR